MHIFKTKYLHLLLLLLVVTGEAVGQVDTVVDTIVDSGAMAELDSMAMVGLDSVDMVEVDSMMVAVADSMKAERPRSRSMLDDVMRGRNTDSLIYDVAAKKIYAYKDGDVKYQDKSLKADNMQIDLTSNEILAYGSPVDSLSGIYEVVQPEFIDGGASYKIDTITYNLKSERAKIKGVATQEGDGWLVGDHVKRMEDGMINIHGGKYTTCDHITNPHFYLAMNRAKVMPGNKVIFIGTHLVVEDVHIPFVGFPEGFFPLNSGPKSGILMPTYGEESLKGFFLRDMGYYFTINDHVDLTLLGGLYSLGSWELSGSSRYVKKYKYTGNVAINYSSIKTGDVGEPDYIKQKAYKVQWSHSQDAKANPGSTFSASVNFTTSGYSKYSATTLSDILSTQTNSSISYSKSWTGYSLSTSMSVSQNSQSESISMTFPTAVFNVSRFYPLKSESRLGDDRWYEKISMSYTGKMTNSVTTTESEVFTRETLDDMTNGIDHSIPISASFSAFNYINITPSVNYSESWYFKRNMQYWDQAANELVEAAPEYGFYRLYDYSTSVSASTTIYGMFQATNANNPVQAIRHTLTPTFGFSFTPDFSQQKYGYYETVQTDSLGSTKTYSPYSSNAYGVPSSGRNLSMNFGLSQTLAIKVRSDRDTSGVRKVTLVDNFSVSGSYNFLSDSMRLSTIPVSFRTTLFGNFGVTLSATLDPYRVTPQGKRYDKLFFPGRITSTSWSYGYTFSSSSKGGGGRSIANDITTRDPSVFVNPYFDYDMEPLARRRALVNTYYDFDIPWNFGFNYVVSYGISYVDNGTTGYTPNITQSVGFNGSITPTANWGFSFTGGYDLKTMQLTTSSVSITRDLHCWQMSMSWIPFGYYRSWSFNIAVKASSLADLKYDKSQSMYDNMY
ncbi:MAG: putative LPS assembly protein LptD [Rikenellaceae bacterium]